MKMRAFILTGLMMVLSVGCATQRVTMDDLVINESRLFVTRSAENVTLSWESEPNLAYTIFYNHTRSASSPWKVLPGFDSIRGTGRTLTYSDRVPVNENRYYRLKSAPAMNVY